MLMLEHHPHSPLAQLRWVSSMSWHNSIHLKDWSLYQTRGASNITNQGTHGPAGTQLGKQLVAEMFGFGANRNEIEHGAAGDG